jgi:hypothetical protein
MAPAEATTALAEATTALAEATMAVAEATMALAAATMALVDATMALPQAAMALTDAWQVQRAVTHEFGQAKWVGKLADYCPSVISVALKKARTSAADSSATSSCGMCPVWG